MSMESVVTHEYLLSYVNLQIQKVKVREETRRANPQRLPTGSGRTPSIGHRYSKQPGVPGGGQGSCCRPTRGHPHPWHYATLPPSQASPNASLLPQSSNEVTLDPTLAMRMRANTVSGGGVGQYLNPAGGVPQRPAPQPPSVAHITVNRRTFAQIHSEYGVPILRDKDLYRQSKKKQPQGGGSESFKIRGQQQQKENQEEQAVTDSPAVVMNLIDI